MDEKVCGTEFLAFQQGVRDRLGRADERHTVAVSTDGCSWVGPEAGIVEFASLRGIQKTVRACIFGWLVRIASAGFPDTLQDGMGALPGFIFGRTQDGTGRDTETDGVGALVAGGGAHTVHEGSAVGQWFAPEHEDIDRWCRHGDGGGGAAATKQGDVGCEGLMAGNPGMGSFEVVDVPSKSKGSSWVQVRFRRSMYSPMRT